MKSIVSELKIFSSGKINAYLFCLMFFIALTAFFSGLPLICFFLTVLFSILFLIFLHRRKTFFEIEIERILNASVHNAIISTDLKGTIIFFNKGAEKMLGYSAGEIEGKKDLIFFYDYEEIIKHAKSLSSKFNQTVSGLEAVIALPKKGIPDRNEWTLTAKNKNKLIVDMVVTPIRKRKGVVLGFLAIARDITEQKNKERELQKIKLELEDSNRTLEHFNRLMLGREERIIELKKEINKISQNYGQEKVYENILDENDDASLLNEIRDIYDNRTDWVIKEFEVFENPILEKRDIQISFMPSLCSAPLLYAHCQGYFAKNGLNVSLNAPCSWSGIKELLVYGQTDAAHMPLPMPLSCGLGICGQKEPVKILAVQCVNGSALTLSVKHLNINECLKMRGFVIGVPSKFSMDYYLLCHFLAESGINPLADIQIVEVPPVRMPYYLENGWIDGFMGPEPFGRITVNNSTGFNYIIGKDIWDKHPYSCLAVTQDFLDKYPHTCNALVKSLVEAQYALRNAFPEEKECIAQRISMPMYLNQPDVISVIQALNEHYSYQEMDKNSMPASIDFYHTLNNEDGIWILTQMQRWNQVNEKIDYLDIVNNIFYTCEAEKWAELFGFPKGTKNFNYFNIFGGHKNPFKVMRSQKFCSFEEVKKTEKNKVVSDADRLDIILTRLALMCGGREGKVLEVYNQDKLGRLENIINETAKNIEYSKNFYEETLARTGRVATEHLTKLKAGRNAMMSLIEDSLKAKREIEIINTELERESRKSQQLALKAEKRSVALSKSRRALIDIMRKLEKEQRKALEASKAKSDFLANMSHEIRTPMNAIIGFSKLLKESRLDEKQKNFVLNILSSGEHLMNIINDILDFSKIEAGKIELENIYFELRYLINGIWKVISSTDKKIRFSLRIKKDVPFVLRGDPTRLRQILINLLNNAVKFTDNGKVSLTVAVKNKNNNTVNLLFSVKDTGIGIPKQKQKIVFDSFTQSDTSTTRNYGGTGLGLAICKKLVNQMKGDISVNSQKGEGSEFVFNALFGYVPYIIDIEKYKSAKEKLGGKKAVILLSDREYLKTIIKYCGDIDIKVDKTFVSEKNFSSYLWESLEKGKLTDIVIFDNLPKNILSSGRLKKVEFIHLEIKKDEKEVIGFDDFIACISEKIDKKNIQSANTMAGNFAGECEGIKVLVAEDNFVNQALIQALFEGFGCEAEFVFNGKDALEKLDANNYDLCLMDLQMPVMSGIDACRIIRQTISKTFPVIALTASASKTDQDECLKAGFSDYLTKPLEVKKLKDTILAFCARP